ncbi:allantoate amidohydrolase [uncultured Microbacterium sp.]|uniref:allantoate amidohydrolase n=1 Tax=uncultured Microbacterium sp. TaxID=191216 RepID=UPI0026093AF4|nr:allantoate amidohydrolase [uncultured Microbacterium sp.]
MPETDVNALLRDISAIGRDAKRGGFSRHVFDDSDMQLREWFTEHSRRLGLDVEHDRNGNIWAWWGAPGDDAVVTGSHLDSVPGGGELDGPLGVASALAAVGRLQTDGWRPTRPFAVTMFAEEEGSRFGAACLGSGLLAGSLDPARVAALTDRDGMTFAEAASRIGLDPRHLGRDDAALRRIGAFVELHVEQGRALIDLGAGIGIGTSILAHGRWRFEFHGQGNHAGATRMADRADPLVAASRTAIAVRDIARLRDRDAPSRCTVGRIEPVPGGTNVIASRVAMWLDLRGEGDADAKTLLDAASAAAQDAAAIEGCTVTIIEESYSGRVDFSPELNERLRRSLGEGVPMLPTGAGHDAGVLSAKVPTAMLFVRNPTGVSHAPEETAEPADRTAGTLALARVLQDLDDA